MMQDLERLPVEQLVRRGVRAHLDAQPSPAVQQAEAQPREPRR